MSGRRPSSPPLRSKTPNNNNNNNNTASSASLKHNNASAAAAVAETDAVLAYFQRYKSFSQREYQQAFGITKLGEALLEGVLALRPEDPFPALAATCAEWHERAKQETLAKYGEILKSRSSSPVPFSRTGHNAAHHHHHHNNSNSGAGLLGGGGTQQQQQRRARSPSAPQHPPAVPWAQATNVATKQQQGPALNRTHLTAASAAHESPQARRPLGRAAGGPPRGFNNSSNASYSSHQQQQQQQTMPFEHRDYIHRQRLTNIFDAWFCALVEAKPFSPALYSMNYFRQRCQMRKCVRSASPPTTGNPRSSVDRDPSPEPPSGSPSLSAPSSDTDRDDSPPAAHVHKNNKGSNKQQGINPQEEAGAVTAAPPRGPISAFGLESAEHDAAAQNVSTPQPAVAAEGGPVSSSAAAAAPLQDNPAANDDDDDRQRLSPDYSAMGRGTLESPSPVLQTS